MSTERCNVSYRVKINEALTIAYYSTYDEATPLINTNPQIMVDIVSTNGTTHTIFLSFDELNNLKQAIRTIMDANEYLPNLNNTDKYAY